MAEGKSKPALIFLNGQPPTNWPNPDDFSKIYCTDGAYLYLKKAGIKPDVIIGDFDSLKSPPKEINCIHTPNQDFTDFEKALDIISASHTFGYVFGGSGKEQDHFLGNLSTALTFRNRIKLVFFDDHQRYFIADWVCKLKDVLGKTVSLFPFPIAAGITTMGLKYPLNNDRLILGERIGIRNEAIKNEVMIRHDSGCLFVFVSHQ